MDKVTNKEILEWTGLPSMKDLLSKNNLRRTGYLLSTVFWSQKERAPSFLVQGYRQEKPEAERHKDRLTDITLTVER